MDDTKPDLNDSMRKRIRQSNYGRDAGWTIEYEKQPVALLTNAQYYDMFWESYDITWLTKDKSLLSKLQDQEFWHEHKQEVVFRNREFGDIPPIGPVVQLHDVNSLIARGLYLVVDLPLTNKPISTWDRFKLWLPKLYPSETMEDK